MQAQIGKLNVIKLIILVNFHCLVLASFGLMMIVILIYKLFLHVCDGFGGGGGGNIEMNSCFRHVVSWRKQ